MKEKINGIEILKVLEVYIVKGNGVRLKINLYSSWVILKMLIKKIKNCGYKYELSKFKCLVCGKMCFKC